MKTGLLALGRQRLKRLAVLIDVQVFAQRNTNASQAYVALIRSCIERVLSVCNANFTVHQNNANWGFKLFDSSLSPIASSSMIQRLLKKTESTGQERLSGVKTAEEKLDFFQQSLSLVASEVNSKSCDPCHQSRSKCEYVIRALQELLSDFTWDSVFMSDGSSSDEDQVKAAGECLGASVWNTQQNLVVVFSHLPDDMKQFADFMKTPISKNATRDSDCLKSFSSKLKKLQDPFRQKSIHACWIDMPHVATSLLSEGKGQLVSIGPDRNLKKQELHEAFALAKWKYTTIDALAIASDCIPQPILWSSVSYPDLPVRPNAPRLQAKLRFSVTGRDGTKLQPDVCKLEAVALDLNILGSALNKESISAALKSGSLATNAAKLSTPGCPLKQTPVVKIVVKSLLQKHSIHFRFTPRYFLHHGVGDGGDRATKRESASCDNVVEKLNSLADDGSSHAKGPDLLRQLQPNPTGFEPGDRAWQVFLITIARKGSVAEVDLFEDGVCSSAILEPLSAQYAAILQKDSSSRRLSSDCNEPCATKQDLSKPSPLSLTVVESVKDLDKQGSKLTQIGKVTRPGKRTAEAMGYEVDPPSKKGKLQGGYDQRSNCADEINPTKREAYSWSQHWRHALRRKTLGTGKVKIENTYFRPGAGEKPSKAMLIIKCWLDQVSKSKPLIEQQLVPVTPVLPGLAESDAGGKKVDGRSSPVRVPKNESGVQEKEFFPRVLDTEEEAGAYLSSIEQMLQGCLRSDSGDLLVFVKGIMSNAIRSQTILLNRHRIMGLVRPLSEKAQPMQDERMLVHINSLEISEKTDNLKPCNSDSSCNMPRVEMADDRSGIDSSTMDGMLCPASGAMSFAMPGNDSVYFRGASDSAVCTVDSKGNIGQTSFASCVAGSRNSHEPLNKSRMELNEAPPCVLVVNQLMEKLLLKPKKLAKNYTDCESVTADSVHIRKEKLRAYEMQILFRMEMIERDWGQPHDKDKSRIVKEICRLLDDIQFDLGGGVFGNESLHDYSIRVIYNRYKKSLPQTVADIFERMEFNGYGEGVSDLQLLPANPIVQVEIHNQKDSEGVITDQLATSDMATGVIIPDIQSLKEKDRTGSTHISSKDPGPIRKRRKRSTPMDAFTRASEKRKLASRLAHFGGPDSLSRLRKIKLHNQSTRAPKVTSPLNENVQLNDRNIVLETPRFERQKVMEDRMDEEEVESVSMQPLTSTFGFGTPARVSKHVQSTTRKRRLALFTQKKPPGRGLPRIPPDVMMAMAEDGTLHQPHKSDHEIVSNSQVQSDCNEGSCALSVTLSSHVQSQRDPVNQGQLPVGTREGSGGTAFNLTDLTGWVLRRQCDQNRLPQNDAAPEISRCAESEIFQRTKYNSCEATCTIRAETPSNQQVHDSEYGISTNTRPVSSRRNRRKSLHASKSRKPDDSAVFSRSPNSPTGTQTLCSQTEDFASPRPEHGPHDLVRTTQPLQNADGSQTIDLTSSENRWNTEDISWSSPTEIPLNRSSRPKSAQDMEDTEVLEVAGKSEENKSSSEGDHKRGFFRASLIKELESSSLPTFSLTKCSELDDDTEVLLQTQIVEEVWNHEGQTASNHTTKSLTRDPGEEMLCLSPSTSPDSWDVLWTDLKKSPNLGQLDRTVTSRMTASPTKSGSPRIWGRQAESPLLNNRTSQLCRIPSSPLTDRRAIEADMKSLKNSDVLSQDLTGDIDFSQVVSEIFQSTKGTEQRCLDEQHELSVDEDVDWLHDLPDLNGAWSPIPRLKPDARTVACYPTSLQRKKVGLDEDSSSVFADGSAIKFSSPTLNKKFSRSSAGSPGQFSLSPIAVGNSKKRLRSTTASPKQTNVKMLRFS